MATRSTIAIELADGTVKQVYCHWDGYVDGVGKTLQEHYSARSKVEELVEHGDLSSLGDVIGFKHPFTHIGTDMTLDEHESNFGAMCTFYGRDREETMTEAKVFQSYQDYIENHQYEEYEYVFRQDNKWHVCDGDEFKLLENEFFVV